MCPATWDLYDGHRYHINTGQKNFYNAESYCKSLGANLVEVNDDASHSVVYNYYVKYANGSKLWVNISRNIIDFLLKLEILLGWCLKPNTFKFYFYWR